MDLVREATCKGANHFHRRYRSGYQDSKIDCYHSKLPVDMILDLNYVKALTKQEEQTFVGMLQKYLSFFSNCRLLCATF